MDEDKKNPESALNADYEKLANELEKDLEDFFALRATERARREDCSEEKRSEKLEDAMSGCCMTGCAGCPWGYERPKPQ